MSGKRCKGGREMDRVWVDEVVAVKHDHRRNVLTIRPIRYAVAMWVHGLIVKAPREPTASGDV